MSKRRAARRGAGQQFARPAAGIRWQPGIGPAPQALARMAAASRKPATVMGEAWFMGEHREMFNYLGATPVEQLSGIQIKHVLREIASGTCSFGHMDEWDDWFAYLLPQVVALKQAPSQCGLVELLITGFFILHPEREDDTDYSDALQTLGQVVMAPSRWVDGRLNLEQVLGGPPAGPSQSWGWWNIDDELSASLFFCFKYLHPEHIKEWTDSLFAIDDPHWRAQILVWLGATRALWDSGSAFPSDLDSQPPDVGWDQSHLIDDKLAAAFIDEENRNAFKDALWPLLELHLESWLESIARIDYLELEALPFITGIDHY